ncbi:hypothetical protein D9X91_08110 [Falsibacillus albus]|uniref:SCP domain-containing protein n=2 Tax=Falsibacillus albus TaxID=2478915 RepID=A0A3L7K0E9_9BACI|nr:hypothetical protein D9X91_08110 [Falsibacillus albus]
MVTRAQMAVFVKRALDYKQNEKSTGQVQEVLNLVNKERAKAGVSPLSLASDVTNVAQVKAEDMMDNNYFSHTSPKYGDPFEMLNHFGIHWTAAGENIAAGQTTPESVMASWMASTGHRENILNPDFKEIGIGFTKGGTYRYYWVQTFIKR